MSYKIIFDQQGPTKMQVTFNGVITISDEEIKRIFNVGVSPKVDTHPTLGEYAGKLVFIEADYLDEKGKTPTYYNGEYLVLRSTPGTLYGVKLSVGYDGHQAKSFALIGKEKYKVIDCYEHDSLVREFIADQIKWSAEVNSPNKRWVETVYSGAALVARQAEEALNAKNRS